MRDVGKTLVVRNIGKALAVTGAVVFTAVAAVYGAMVAFFTCWADALGSAFGGPDSDCSLLVETLRYPYLWIGATLVFFASLSYQTDGQGEEQ